MRAQLLLTATLLATSFLAGCLETKEAAAPVTSSQGPTPPATAPRTVTVTAQDVPPSATPGKPYTYSPNRLEAKVNETLNIVLKGVATNQLNHDLRFETSPDPNFKGIGQVKADSKNATLVATQAGSFKFYCSVGGSSPTGHRALGMEGTLIVGAPPMPTKGA